MPRCASPQLIYEPHPLAVEQPAFMSVRVTRRPETTGIPDQAASTCSLIVWNSAVNPIYGVKLEGALFSGLGMQTR